MRGWIAIVLLAAAPCFSWAEEPLDKDFRLFTKFYEGEFNNHNQVYFETNEHDGVVVPEEVRHPWHHTTVSRVEAPSFGEHVFVARITEEGPDGAIVRHRVNVFEFDYENGTILQSFYAFESDRYGEGSEFDPTDLHTLQPSDLRSYPDGCQVVWRRQADQFLGTIAKGDCAVESRMSGKTLYIWAEMVLAENESWHAEGGTDENFEPVFGPPGDVPFKFHRVNYFNCWVAFLKDEEAKEWDFFRDVRIGDQGGVAELATTHDEPRHYRLQLMQTVFPAGDWPDVLEFFVYEKGKDKALSYAWTSPNAERIGLNLRWMQAGCGLEKSR